MANSITKNRINGRPTKKTDAVIKKVLEALRVGATITQACLYARITTQTFYNWVDGDPAFLMEVEAAQHYLSLASKQVVSTAIVKDKSLSTAQYWLNTHDFRDTEPQKPIGPTINVLNMGADARKSFNEEFKKFLKGFYAPSPVAL